MKNIVLTITLFSCFNLFAEVDRPLNLITPPETKTETSITLLWDKPKNYQDVVGYEIYQGDFFVGFSYKTNYTIKNLQPNTSYTFHVKSKHKTGVSSTKKTGIIARTKPQGEIINILDYGAVGDGVYLNTENIQKAIDDCPSGSTVFVPKGVFLTGALFLKSDMTLYIDKDAILKGSIFAKHYRPFIFNRFEGWEVETYASLLNAGKMDNSGGFSVENLSIRGEGKIIGGGMALGGDMIASRGMRGRGRLICLMNCKNVSIHGLTIEDAPCWTIHYIYSKNVSLSDLTINSLARNGDGIDPDSSTDSYIFNCTFRTNDDCIAIKSGKNPEGFYINKPTENIFISNCNFIEGHGISIGSEMSGGVRNVVVRDCVAGNLMHGLQIKGTKDRGGIVENIHVADCELPLIRIFTSVSYNNDGEPAPELPLFRNFTFLNIDMSKTYKNNIIEVQGFQNIDNYTQNIVFENIITPEKAVVKVTNSKTVRFENLKSKSGKNTEYIIKESVDVKTPSK